MNQFSLTGAASQIDAAQEAIPISRTPSARRCSILASVIAPPRRRAAIALLTLFWLEAAVCQAAGPSGVVLPEGQTVVSAGTTLEKRVYRRPASPDQAAIVIRGQGFTVDFRGAVLQGADQTKVSADNFKGIGILLDGCRDVNLRNAVVNGYMVGIMAKNCLGIRLETCDASGNRCERIAGWGQWLDGHALDAWRSAYGAGFLLDGCKGVRMTGCRSLHAQNGILMLDCSGCEVLGCNASFNSSWGLAMHGSSNNRVLDNRFDFCVRCEKWGKDSAGGDSAGILVMQGSCDNLFAYNRATHCGDGFFLSAAAESLENPSSRNLVAFNDFSYSPHNAIEATFSTDNVFYGNICHDSGYGVWAGFSSRSSFIRNEIDGCLADGIAIEHGAGNRVDGNLIANAGKGVNFWKIPPERDPNNPKRHNPSRDARIFRNEIRRCREAAIYLAQTQDTVIRDNCFSRNGTTLAVETGSSGVRFQGNRVELESPRPENLAAKGVASASCSPETAARALDGVCRGDDHAWAPGHVRVGDWFQVDLKKACEVDSVVLFPRDGNTHDFCRVFRILGSKTGEFHGEETLLCKEIARPHKLVVPYAFPKGDYRYLRLVNDEVVDWVHLEEFEVFLWPNIVEEYFSGGVGVRNASKALVDARGNFWMPASPSPDKQAQRAGADSGQVLTSGDAGSLLPLPAIKIPDLPAPKSAWRVPAGMPHGRDKIALNDWGPVVPDGWKE
ncbi:MAG: right-handed parallel beta-helix repeat-containing protein [Thermoguttaceae bacterium]